MDCFGVKHFGSIFGLVFTAYGFVAGFIGPSVSGYVLDATSGNFHAVFTYLGLFLSMFRSLYPICRTAQTYSPGTALEGITRLSDKERIGN